MVIPDAYLNVIVSLYIITLKYEIILKLISLNFP